MPYKNYEDRLKNNRAFYQFYKEDYHRYRARIVEKYPDYHKAKRKRALQLHPDLDTQHYFRYKDKPYNKNKYKRSKELHPNLCQEKYLKEIQRDSDFNKKHWQKYKNKSYNKNRQNDKRRKRQRERYHILMKDPIWREKRKRQAIERYHKRKMKK